MTEIIVVSLHPQIEASTRSNIDETRHPDVDMATDSAQVKEVLSQSWREGFSPLQVVSCSPPPLHKHPHLGKRSKSRWVWLLAALWKNIHLPPPAQGGKEICM